MRLVNIYIFKGIVSQNFKGSVSRDFFSYTFFLQNTLPRAVFVTCKKPTTKIVLDLVILSFQLWRVPSSDILNNFIRSKGTTLFIYCT